MQRTRVPFSAVSRRTKIVCTIGPASSSPERLRGLIEHGMTVARINASHGDHETHARAIALVREQAAILGRTVGILFDLQGPKIRVGQLAEPREVKAGDIVALAVGRPPEGDELPADYPLLDRDVTVGHRLLIDDGHLATEVIGVEKGLVRCRAFNDGVIASRKGINLPDSAVSAPAVTNKDKDDAKFAVAQGVDAIALSFVRRAQDIQTLAEVLESVQSNLPIISKIEKPQALDNLEEILQASWGVMVARGDLGVELSPEEVPMAQKRIIREARRLNKPVITATQMLESMTRNPRPTRAEASDVANAVLDGTDAVMLSGETASGRYPVETVSMMGRIIDATERIEAPEPFRLRRRDRGVDTISKAVVDAGCAVAEHIGAKGILAFTNRGSTAVLASERRPPVPILAFSPNPAAQHILSLVWGVEPYHLDETEHTDALVAEMDKVLVRENLAVDGDTFVLLMGGPARRPGRTLGMLVHRVGSMRAKNS